MGLLRRMPAALVLRRTVATSKSRQRGTASFLQRYCISLFRDENMTAPLVQLAGRAALLSGARIR